MKFRQSNLIAQGINEINARRASRASAAADVLTALVLGVAIGLMLGVAIGLMLVWGLS